MNPQSYSDQLSEYFFKILQTIYSRTLIKDAVKSVLGISSAHNKGGPTDVRYKYCPNFQSFKLF
jgi:hypothetical protein